MYSRNVFFEMRRAGLGVGISSAKLSAAMLDVLLQLPAGSMNLKESVVRHLGLLGQMTPVRDINQAWNQTKKKAAGLYPEKFILEGRNTLAWNNGTKRVLDKDISSANLKKLNDLADIERCTVNAMVAKLIKSYKRDGG
jgi:hypothetical protein